MPPGASEAPRACWGRSRSLPGGSILTVIPPPHPSTCFDVLYKLSFQQLLVCGCSVEPRELRKNAGPTEGKKKPRNVAKRKLPWPLPGKSSEISGVKAKVAAVVDCHSPLVTAVWMDVAALLSGPSFGQMVKAGNIILVRPHPGQVHSLPPTLPFWKQKQGYG